MANRMTARSIIPSHESPRIARTILTKWTDSRSNKFQELMQSHSTLGRLMTALTTPVPHTESEYVVTSDAALLPMNEIVRLVHLTKWAKTRPAEMITKAARNSLCFGVRYGDGLAAFARLVTDYTTYAYLCDVIVDPA